MKQQQKAVLMFKNLIFVAITWLAFVYVSGLLLMYIESALQIHNSYFDYVFMYHKASPGRAANFFYSNTPFEIASFFIIGYLYIKYYYKPRVKKL